MALVEMWFDPICPWAWITSRWLLEVERVREVEVRFHIMSLSLLNDGDIAPDAALDPRVIRRWGPARVVAATRLSYGDQAVRELYSALGPLLHQERLKAGRDLYARALTRAGLPYTLANAAGQLGYDDEVRASHRAAMAEVGGEIGTPIVHLRRADGAVIGFFGPVVTPTPRGDAAGRLWDAVNLAAEADGFLELKRVRTVDPSFD